MGKAVGEKDGGPFSVISSLLFSTLSSPEPHLLAVCTVVWSAFDIPAVETPGEIFFAAATCTLDVIN